MEGCVISPFFCIKKGFWGRLLAAYLFFACSLSTQAASANTQQQKLTLIYSSTIRNIEQEQKHPGFSYLASYLQRERAQAQADEPVLFVYGGDSIGPSMLSSFDKGVHIIDILNTLEPDLMAVGARDFSYFEDELSLRAYEASFPMLATNIHDPLTGSNLEGMDEYYIYEVNGFKIGFFAIVDPEVEQKYLPKRIEAQNPYECAHTASEYLRRKGADIIIMMTGKLSTEEYRQLERHSSADILFTNGSAGSSFMMTEQGILRASMSYDNRYAIKLELELTRSGRDFSWTHEATEIDLSRYKPDENVKQQTASYTRILKRVMDHVLGETITELDTRHINVRTMENAFANLVTDAIREKMQAEVALINGGSLRGDRFYPAGSELTRLDIQSEMPFFSYAVKVDIKGEQLWDALEHSLTRLEERWGGFPHLSGARISYQADAPSGQRLKTVSIAGKELDPERTYSLATSNFLVDGGDGYDMLKPPSGDVLREHESLIWEIVRDYILIHGEVSPAIEGRIRALEVNKGPDS